MKIPVIWKATDKKLTFFHGSEIGKLVMTESSTRRPGVSLKQWKKHVITKLEFAGFKYHGLKS
jgi:hypothetical protein